MPRTIEPPYKTLPKPTMNTVKTTDTMYFCLDEAGLLQDGRYELLDGEVVLKMSIKRFHWIVIFNLLRIALRFVEPNRLTSQTTVRLGPYGVPEPDFALFAEDKPIDDPKGYSLADGLTMVAEVSDSTLDSDLTVKAKMYARAGVPEYWVVDIEGRRVVVHTQPAEDGYTAAVEYIEGDVISPDFASSAEFSVAEIFGSDRGLQMMGN